MMDTNKMLEELEKAYNENNLDEANNLLNGLDDVIKPQELITFYKQALTIAQKTNRLQRVTSTILNNLALLYHSQGEYEQAEPLYRRALQISEAALGPIDPDTATTLNNLAGLYQAQGKYEQAEPLYRRALQISEAALGPSHPDTATALNNLAGLYQAQGKYEQAEPLYRRALQISEDTLGKQHPSTLTISNNLAKLEIEQQQSTFSEISGILKSSDSQIQEAITFLEKMQDILARSGYLYQDTLQSLLYETDEIIEHIRKLNRSESLKPYQRVVLTDYAVAQLSYIRSTLSSIRSIPYKSQSSLQYRQLQKIRDLIGSTISSLNALLSET